jgi:acetoin utilization protein AcuB
MMVMSETVAQRMARDPYTLKFGDTLRTAVELEMEKRIRHFPVVDEQGHLRGIVTDRDIKRALPSPLLHLGEDSREKLLDETPIERIMTKDPFTIAPATPLAEAARLMLDKKIGGLPVAEHGKLVGLITQGDLLRAFLERLDAEK